MRRFFVSFVFYQVAVFAVCAQVQAPAADFRVTIIAVTKFDDPKLSGPDEKDLNDANIEAAMALKSYFQTFQISPAPDLYIVSRETSQEFLRNWLFHDLRLDSRTGTHLIFVLTHGFADQGPDAQSNQSEIYLATSDTHKDAIPGKAIRGGDFVDAFQFMPKRGTVFLFLDTCGSGAIDNEHLRRLLQSEPDFASRVLIIAAANSDELAYRARFTKALLDVWQAKPTTLHCGPMQIERFLTESLRKVPGVSPDVKQTVRVVAPLSPDFCIESFNYTQRFLMLYNAFSGDVSITLQADDETEPEARIDLKEYEMAPVSALRPTKYSLVAQRNLGTGQADQKSNLVENVDLTTVPAKVEVLFSSDPLDQPRAEQSAAQYLDSRRILPSYSASLAASSIKTVEALSDNARGELQNAESQRAALRQDAEALEPELERKRKVVEEAQNEHQKAEERKNQALATADIGGLKEEIEKTSAEQEAANSEYERAVQKQREIADKIQALIAHTAELEAEVNRFYVLKNSMNQLAGKRAAAKAIENSAGIELQSAFSDLQRTDRGLLAVVRDVNQEEMTKSDRLRKFVAISNHYPMLNVEIELFEGGEDTIENQVAIRARAAKFMQGLRELGLQSENVVARGFTTPGKDPITLDLIMSQP
jgi:hypothetical protein